jgi:hypothetical protein
LLCRCRASVAKAVNLPPEQFARFRRWLEAFEATRFDQKIERDAKAGKLGALVDQTFDVA